MTKIVIDTSKAEPPRRRNLRIVNDVSGDSIVPDADEPTTSWHWVNLKERWETRGHDVITTVGCIVDDLFCLFYPGKINAVFGKYEHGKTWLMKLAVVQQVKAECHVFYFDFEDDDNSLTGDLLKLGLTLDQVDEFVHYASIEDACDAETQAWLVAEAKRLSATLAVVDGTTEALSLERLSSNSGDDFSAFCRIYAKKLAKVGLAVVLLDHPAKADKQGDSQIGSQHKGATISGAQYFMKVKPDSPLKKGSIGISNIYLRKDRPGSVRPFEVGDNRWVAQLVLDSTNADGTSTIFVRPVSGTVSDSAIPLDQLNQSIAKYLRHNQEKWFKAAEVKAGAGLEVKTDTVKRHLEDLYEDGQHSIARKQEHERAPVWFGYFPDDDAE